MHGISAFQAKRINLQTFLQYFPSPWGLAPGSGIYRSLNSAPDPPISKISASPFLHEDAVQSGHKNSFEQPSVCTTTYQNLSPIGDLLHGTLAAPTCSLLAQAGITETHAGMPIVHGISVFQVHRIHQSTL